MMNANELFVAIQHCNADYAAAIDTPDLPAWVELFTEDGLYLAQPRENADRGLPLATIRCEGKGMLRDRVLAIHKTMVFTPRYVRHIISAPRVEGMKSVSNFVVFQTLHMQPTQTLATGEYRDEWVLENTQLKLKSRRAVFDTELVPNSLIYPL
jgi:3-phenylpropionate/cinnamic acid dioxygenase small subunit